MIPRERCRRCGVELDTDAGSDGMCPECAGRTEGCTSCEHLMDVHGKPSCRRDGRIIASAGRPEWCPLENEGAGTKPVFTHLDEPVEEDDVDHPAHYTRGAVETIDALEAWFPGTVGHKWSAIKYLSRAGHKDDELKDLRKARWYVDRAIRMLERGQ